MPRRSHNALAKARWLSWPSGRKMARLLALSSKRPPSRSNVSTILSLFEGGADAPRELTRFDLGYLRALYAADGTTQAGLERGRIAASLAENGR